MLENIDRWRRHSPMTDPANESFLFDGLPVEIGALCRIIQGLLIHSEWTDAYGLSEPRPSPSSRETLPLSQRLRHISQADPGPLTVPRAAGARSSGTCRDFALMLCGMLRHQGVPARIRCGFAAYLGKSGWEDHWICEYWSPTEGRWCRADPQLDEVMKKHLGIDFEATDMPPAMFMTAGDAWHLCRTARSDPSNFGHGVAKGLWFIRVNVVRDHYALNQSEVSVWDSWRSAVGRHETVADSDREAADRMALYPEEAAGAAITPPWLS